MIRLGSSRILWKRFFGAWLIALASLSITRLVFYANLRSYFIAEPSELIRAFLFGLQFDAVSIAYLFGPFFLVLPFIHRGNLSALARIYFVCMLAAINLLNCIDAEFYRYMARRSTDDLFEYAFLSNDVFNLAPGLVGQYWYLLLSWVLVVCVSCLLYGRLFSDDPDRQSLRPSAVTLIPIVLLLFLGTQGGFRSSALSIMDAGKTGQQHLNAITLNTSFTILKTMGKPELERFDFVEDELPHISPIRAAVNGPLTGRYKSYNVVVIIVESLAKEYVGAINGLKGGYTPFVDSLCNESLVFTDAFANGQRSIEGVPAVVASIPTLMYESFSTSQFADNRINSLADLLRDEGYFTAFMHGGNRNSMNFDPFAMHAGFNLFYDRDDYPFPDAHYDGTWGISDHYFLNHCVEKFDSYNEPFLGCIFTLSSHFPYTIPQEYEGVFPKGNLPIHESIGYVDESLRQFFANAQHSDWYDSTLFVITADHTSLTEHPEYRTKLGAFRIPIILFHPGDTALRGRNARVMQQIDIMPTIMHLVGYERPFFSFGVNVFDEDAEHVAIAYKYHQHQMLKDGQLTCFDGENVTFVHDATAHGLPARQLRPTDDGRAAYLKRWLENYSAALNDDRMTHRTWTGDKQ